jgi:hypothetical protein
VSKEDIVDKKRLTLLLTDDQIHKIKVKAAMAGMPANAWIIEQLNIDTEEGTLKRSNVPNKPQPEDDTGPAADVQEIQPDPVTDAAALDAVVPDCKGRTISKAERDGILIALAKALPEPKHAQRRIDLLNAKQVPVCTRRQQYGGQWSKKQFTNLKRLAKLDRKAHV